jgi:hypothetical protein
MTLDRIQELLNNFVTGPLKVSRDRMYLPADRGGLGLVNLDNFLTGLHVAWVKKACVSSRDNWRCDMRSITFGNCLNLSLSCPDIRLMPAIRTIAADFEHFKSKFYTTGNNYKHAFVLYNKLFCMRDKSLITETVFRANVPRLDLQEVAKLKFNDFFLDNRPKSLDELIADTGINFSLVTYMRIMPFFEGFRRRLAAADATLESVPLTQFLNVKKGEAKKVRGFLDGHTGTGSSIGTSTAIKQVKQLQIVKTFFRVTNIVVIPDFTGKILGLWNKCYLPNKVREFIFKFYNNQLSINTRLSHYTLNRTRSCTFCMLAGAPAPADETFLHIFFECETVRRIHSWFVDRYFFILNQVPAHEREDRKKNSFFLAI